MAKEAKIKEKKTSKEKIKKHFFKDTKAELKKVIWPTSKQLVNNTIAVVAIVIVIGVIVFTLDVCFEKLNSVGVEKLKSVVQANTVSNETVENNTVAESNDSADTTSDDVESVETTQDTATSESAE